MKVSVIIPAYNEELEIQQTLLSLQKQEYKDLEIIVVANACTDNTVSLARPLCDTLIKVKDKGISRAKNLGVKHASGDIFVFLDADTSLPPNTVSNIVRSIRRGADAGRLFWKSRDKKGFEAFVIALFDNFFQLLFSVSRIFPEGAGACLFMTKELAATISNRYGELWNTSLTQLEDIDMIKRLKSYGSYRPVFRPCALTSFRRHSLKIYLRDELKELFFPHKERDWDSYRNGKRL